MKLLVQSDDYGITKAQAAGVIEGIRNGIIRNTGLFVNMPWSSECVEWVFPYLDIISFGIDLNASTGCSLLTHNQIPSLTHPDGHFLKSRENRALDTEENNYDHIVYDELYAEFEAQFNKFVELTGRYPDYIHPHAYITPTTRKVIHDLSAKYGCPFSMEFMKDNFNEVYAKMSWVKMGEPSLQNESDLKNYILNDTAGLLSKKYGYLVTHCGYVDSDIMKLSSFNLVRMRDLEAVCCEEVKNWITDNNIELVTFKDLVNELKNKEDNENELS